MLDVCIILFSTSLVYPHLFIYLFIYYNYGLQLRTKWGWAHTWVQDRRNSTIEWIYWSKPKIWTHGVCIKVGVYMYCTCLLYIFSFEVVMMLHITILSNINKPHSRKHFAYYKHINHGKLTHVTKMLSCVIGLFANLT